MAVIREALISRPAPRCPNGFLITLLVLTLILFVFDSTIWRQVYGTAMGTRVAPTFTCVFMGWLGTAMLVGRLGVKVRMWRRLIYDCLFFNLVWDGGGTQGVYQTLQLFPQHHQVYF